MVKYVHVCAYMYERAQEHNYIELEIGIDN